jgi:hypothetical protein
VCPLHGAAATRQRELEANVTATRRPDPQKANLWELSPPRHLRRRAGVVLLVLAVGLAFLGLVAVKWLGSPQDVVARDQLRGVNRAGAEYSCVEGKGIFDAPTDAASVGPMLDWRINAVRVPLNEDCWLGVNGIPTVWSGENYQAGVQAYVANLRHAGLKVILALMSAAPGNIRAEGSDVMPDADHSERFWRSVAQAYRSDRGVAFDLYNEPHDVSPGCWRDGCITATGWRAVGMQALVNAVRATGATNQVQVEGLAYGNDLSQWLAYRPVDPANNLAAGVHMYNMNSCVTTACWDATIRPIVAAGFPVVTGELGENDCSSSFIARYMDWADTLGVSYLAWQWGPYSCAGGPSLISSFDGTPTPFGAGFRGHLLHLTLLRRRPSAPNVTRAASMAQVPYMSFEDGTSEGWHRAWGRVKTELTQAPTSTGRLALALGLMGPDYPAVQVTAGSLKGLAPGSDVVLSLYVPPDAPLLQVEPYIQDTSWNVYKVVPMLLKTGWNLVAWRVPAAPTIGAMGLQLNIHQPWSGSVVLDDIGWTTPTVTPLRMPSGGSAR